MSAAQAKGGAERGEHWNFQGRLSNDTYRIVTLPLVRVEGLPWKRFAFVSDDLDALQSLPQFRATPQPTKGQT